MFDPTQQAVTVRFMQRLSKIGFGWFSVHPAERDPSFVEVTFRDAVGDNFGATFDSKGVLLLINTTDARQKELLAIVEEFNKE